MHEEQDTGKPRPVVALMGEFSAGKSTLANILLGEHKSPVKVTATQQPPIWFTHGPERAEVVGLDGSRRPVEIDAIAEVDRASTAYVTVSLEADVLEIMDLIDMPGISDPNTPPEVWKRVIGNADHVIWCTHAIQAWRQSEAATWEELPPSLYDKSLLLLTRFDKIHSDHDRRRVLARVRAETAGLFAEVFPISLLEASLAGDDRAAWEASGAEVFSNRLVDMLQGRERVAPRTQPALPPMLAEPVAARRPVSTPTIPPVQQPVAATQEVADPDIRIVPRRVRIGRTRPHTPRPDRAAPVTINLAPTAPSAF